jgi:hypothetical protein
VIERCHCRWSIEGPADSAATSRWTVRRILSRSRLTLLSSLEPNERPWRYRREQPR